MWLELLRTWSLCGPFLNAPLGGLQRAFSPWFLLRGQAPQSTVLDTKGPAGIRTQDLLFTRQAL